MADETFATGRLSTGGESIYFESAGRGAPVVLCHGLGGNHAIWWQQVPVLASSRRVITWDQRGFGNSTRAGGSFGPATAVADLGALIEHLGLDRVHLVGQSMGGWVAMGYALAHPERVRSLVLTDTLAGVITPEIERVATEARSRLMTRLAANPSDHPALSAEFSRTRPREAFLYERISSFGDKPADADVLAMLGQTRFDLDAVGALALPTLLVCGSLDDLCPPDAMELIARLIKGARLQIIPGAGHSPYFEQADAWNATVLQFLESQSTHA